MFGICSSLRHLVNTNISIYYSCHKSAFVTRIQHIKKIGSTFFVRDYTAQGMIVN